MKYAYVAYDSSGTKTEGTIEAINGESAIAKLKADGFIPVKIVPEEKKSRVLPFLDKLFNKISIDDVEFFSSEMALLLANGIKVDAALEIVSKGMKKNYMKKFLDNVLKDVRRGKRLSDAFSANGDIFDSLYLNIIAIGETTGNLATSFENVAKNLRFKKQIAKKIKFSLTYPAVILVVCFLAIVFIFDFIVPKFSVIFSSMKHIPIYTEFLLKFSEFFRRYQLGIFFLILISPLLLMRFSNDTRIKKILDRLIISITPLKKTYLLLENLRFSSSMNVLLNNGITIDQAITLSIDSIKNINIKRSLEPIKSKIKQGKQLSEVLAKIDFYPEMFLDLIKVGESSGSIAHIFGEIEFRLSEEFEAKIIRLTNLLEPLIIVFMGIIVGFIVITLLMGIISIEDISF